MWMLLHGFTGSPRSWDPVIAHATLEQDPWRPALFGHSHDWHELSVASFADEVERLCTLASSRPAPRLIAGYSLGARVAAGMLATAPALFAGAVLIGLHPGLASQVALRERREADARRAQQLRQMGLPAFVADWERQELFATQAALPAELKEHQRGIRLEHNPEGLARSLESLGLGGMPHYGDALAALSIPITLMAGERDEKFRDLATELGQRSAHIELVTIEGAGHNLLLEAHSEVSEQLRQMERRAMRGLSA
jgi:2-succinyl-6-hydroxy-2,4-cyclohexadiene-1-carboxylate synthase